MIEDPRVTKDGVLRVTLPKREEVKPRQIQISVKTDADATKSAKATAGENK